MTFWFAILLGLVQGLTEFLPVSSSGHLVLINKLLGNGGDLLLVSILLHVATLLAVLIVFRREVWKIIRNPFGQYSFKIILSFIPTVIIVFVFKSFIEDAFSGSFVSICFLITALLLMACDFFAKEKDARDVKFVGVSRKSAIIMGISQGLAVVPGISRSGATICTGLFLGENREEVAKFSFLMSVPVIIASLFYEIIFSTGKDVILKTDIFPIIVSFIVAFIVGLFAIKIMLRVVKKARYVWFSLYLAILGIVSIFII